MGVEHGCRYVGWAALTGFEDRVVAEDVLFFGLYHVVALRAETCDVTVDVDCFLTLIN